MSGQLEQLLVLQDIDLHLDQAHHRRGNLPERDELDVVDRKGTDTNRELAAAEAAGAEVGSRQAITEAELASTENRIAAIDKRLYSGEVTSTKDLQAMSAEVAHLRTRASGMEDDVLRLLEEQEPFDKAAAELRATLVELGATRAQVVSRLAAAESEIDGLLDSLAADRSGALKGVPADLLATYDRLRAHLGGVGVARVVGNHCDGCHLTLSAVELDRIRHRPDEEIYTCEQCSRILVP